MRLKKLLFIAAISATFGLFSACSEDPITPEINVGLTAENFFEKSMDFTSVGGQKVLNFTTNVDWTLSVAETQGGYSWCNVLQQSGGAGTFSIPISVTANEGYDDRNVIIVLKAGELEKNVIVNQKQKDAITLTTDRFEVGNEGGSIDIEIKSNIDYSFEIPEKYQGWISQASKTRALSTKYLSFTISESKEYDKREGEIIITSGAITETVKVYQSGSAILILSQNEYTFGSEGGTVSIDISSNFEYEIDMPDADWIKAADKTRAVSSHTLVYNVSENTTHDNREAVIVFKNSKSNKKESVTIKQKQKDAIISSSNKVEVGNEGGTIDIEVKSNIDYSIEIPEMYQGWISQASKTRALSTNNLSFIISESKEYDKREGEIIITSGAITEIVKVYQSGSAILIVSQNEYTLGSDGGTVSIDISSNFEYEIDMPDVNWLKAADKTRAISSHTLAYNVSENTTHDDREAVIVFRNSKSNKKESVTIKQKQKDAVILSSNKVEVAQDGGSFSVDVNSNVDYSIEIASSCSNWVSQTSTQTTRALVKTTKTFKVAKSENYDKREGEIYFKHNDITDTLKVYQSGGAILVLSQDSYNIEGSATSINVQLKSNIDYNVSITNDWITEISTRAVSSSSKNFNIATNKTGKSRTGNITFSSSDGTKTAIVTVTQATVIEAKSLNINFSNISGTVGGYLYIGKKYGFSVSCSPSNAATNYKWEVENTNIASISGSGSSATLSTKDYGKTKVIVTETNSGISESYEIGTCVTDFQFKDNTGETAYGYPALTMLVGEKHQLVYSYTPSYATNVFSNLKSFKFKEVFGNAFVIVNEPTVIDIEPSGTMTAKKVGQTIINVLGDGVFKKDYNTDGVYVNVVEYYNEKEDNNTFGTANVYKGPTKFSLYDTNDVDVFEITLPKNGQSSASFDITLESLNNLNLMGHKISVFDTNGQVFGIGNASGKTFTQGRSGWSGQKMYIQISWNPDPYYYKYWWNYNHNVKLTITHK